MRISDFFVLLALLIALPTSLHAQDSDQVETPRTFEMKQGDSTITMKQYIMVLLKSGDTPETLEAEDLKKAQQGHHNNIRRLMDLGKMIIAGPFGDDGELQGIFLLDCATVEEAQKLVATDPLFQTGHLKGEFHPWWGAVGTTLK